MHGRSRSESVRMLACLVALTAAGVLAMSGSAGATALSYTFNSNNQSWLQSQDGLTFTTAGFQATDGNPGGRLAATDTGADNGCPSAPCNLLYFESPQV